MENFFFDWFWELYEKSPEIATEWFYKFSGDNNYIRRSRIAKDVYWTVDSEYGEIEITINRSKPEKDPKAIAAAAKMQATDDAPAYHFVNFVLKTRDIAAE